MAHLNVPLSHLHQQERCLYLHRVAFVVVYSQPNAAEVGVV